MSSAFDLYVGIDWTGAQPAKAVAVAAVGPDRVVHPIAPAGRYWGRAEAAEWVAARVREGQRVLAGIDCGFGMPWVPGVGYLDGRVPDVTDMPGLWDLVEAASGGAPDDFAGLAVTDPRLTPSYWVSGPRPAMWGDGSTKRRRTELAAAATGAGTPVSLFNLAAAAKQVGKASLAGMRTLRRLKGMLGERIAVWPAEAPAGRSVVLEIYPTLFRLQALGRTLKITDRAVLERALAPYGCRAAPGLPDRLDDHTGDAMISAAGLSILAGKESAWAPAGLDPDTARREGWIFGVGA